MQPSSASNSASTARPAAHLRVVVCPPAVVAAVEPWWRRALHWLAAPPLAAQPSNHPNDHPNRPPQAGLQRLERVRADFLQVIADLDGHDAELLAAQIRSARSPRELWHLRSAVFGLFALQRSQAEAAQRVAALNRHFPTRAPRSGFGSIDG